MVYRTMFEIEVRHDGLNKYRHIRGSNKYVVEQKADAQARKWDEMWQKKQAAEIKKIERDNVARDKEEKRELAKIKTEEAQATIDGLKNVLSNSLSVDNRIDWDSLIDKSCFPEPLPDKPTFVECPDAPQKSDKKYQPTIIEPPPPPQKSDKKYKPNFNKLNLGFFAGFSAFKVKEARKRIIEETYKAFKTDYESWEESKKFIKKKNEEYAIAREERFKTDYDSWQNKKLQIEQNNKKLAKEYIAKVKEWKIKKKRYESRQLEKNKIILDLKQAYLNKEVDAVNDYCEMVLSNSEYPEFFPQEWEIEYRPENKILIIEYSLPDKDALPTIKSVKYVISTDKFSETHLSITAINQLYDSLLYQIALRTIHEMYAADTISAIQSIVFNGWVNSVDKATGQNMDSCIMSVQASKEEFTAINLEKVDPKACFRRLKGVGSSKLYSLSPIAPIINIDKNDRRFIAGYDVADTIDESNNLAAMDWQDFENLIREVFEKEFSSSGGDVKITRASRDGGVDAIAFDPDPIRGGKIIIQAKRYTNVVGVSAVRDLFGTVMNEGAIKGILVTTADYGPDAYEFAKGKPITLLNGGNMLHLLEKYGHKARIDLKEAKQILAEQKV